MIKNTKILLATILILGVSSAIDQTQLWFDNQILNHDLPTSNSTWSQRYWVIDEYFDPSSGPIILHICGEYTCDGLPEDRQWPAIIAQKYKGLVLTLEHRYYGLSQPFGNESLKFDNMYLLTISQALDDLATFIQWVSTTGQHKVTTSNPWITIGGSYPGALSAWFRSKYPHLTIGALASSGVANAILDFPKFDEQIKNSALKSSEQCAESIHKLNFYAQEQVNDPATSQSFKAQYNATEVSNGQFLWFFADMFVLKIQYENRTWLCDNLADKTLEEQYQFVLEMANTDYSNAVQSYSSYYLSYDKFDPSNPQGDRQWTYQFCSEVGFFQTPSTPYDQAERSPLVNMDMFIGLCTESFGNNDVFPTVDRVNLRFGGVDIETFNIVFTNGVEDPWRWASIQESKEDMISIVIDCTDCAHCVDLYTPTVNDAPELKSAREVQIQQITKWIDEYNKKNGFNYQSEPLFEQHYQIEQ